MITGVHTVIFNRDPEATRRFFAESLGMPAVDAGGGWLIFALPPAELGIHPTDASGSHEIFLMCDDIHTTVAELTAKGVEFAAPIEDQRFGLVTRMKIPGDAEVSLYQPKHPAAITLTG